MEPQINKPSVFVTYRWESEEYSDKVISFTDYLRRNGFNAVMDELLSQEESAIDFPKMMHNAFTKYDKVIILISPGYKERADNFVGGVGFEYGILIKDFEQNKNKYIIASLLGIDNLDSQTPLYLKGKEVIDLTNSKKHDRLFAKLLDEKIIEFSPVGESLPPLQKKFPSDFISKPNISIDEIKVNPLGSSSYRAGQIVSIDYNLSFILKNISNLLIDDYSFEIYLPKNFYNSLLIYYRRNRQKLEFSSNREEDGYNVLTCDAKKIFPSQSIAIKSFAFSLTREVFVILMRNPIRVKLYIGNHKEEREFQLNDYLHHKAPTSHHETKVLIDSFK